MNLPYGLEDVWKSSKKFPPNSQNKAIDTTLGTSFPSPVALFQIEYREEIYINLEECLKDQNCLSLSQIKEENGWAVNEKVVQIFPRCNCHIEMHI